jgi:hypothetical protein
VHHESEPRKISCRWEGGHTDDVDAAHLLSNHHNERGNRRAAHSGNGEKLGEATDVAGATLDGELRLEHDVDVVEVSRGLELVVAKALERPVGSRVAVLAHQPPRALWAEIDPNGQWDSGDEGAPELEAPRDGTRVGDDDVGLSVQHSLLDPTIKVR